MIGDLFNYWSSHGGRSEIRTKRFRRHSRRIQDRVGDLTQVAQEAIDAQRVVKAFGGQAREALRFNTINEKTRALQMKMIATEAASVPLVQLISAAAIGVVVYYPRCRD
ncbi:hypothetical protein CXB77_08585 [Chromatium okenii]|uniref:ABC transmembrane type-1 domain-containing protein n=1 Tax=Chromatium okenii TaxID=61644 RepID=A0A2S7XQE0_9GAMM|nr:hypothetical protein CXB77_08585 [Chromatium okenii]